jgi:flagellar biosynthesis GTPase FlhF|uniref:Uncharacterized protein n=1 Tax=viral metagenome TaxID=1070528 RepID=A0A6C0IYY9_9ZZZZ
MTSKSPSSNDLLLKQEKEKDSSDLNDKNQEVTENKSDKNQEVTKNKSDEPSHIMTGDYAVLMETNGKECESWYYFIRCENNWEELKHLQEQLEQIDWYILDDLSTFDLDLEHLVDAKTAKQMTKLELNSYAFHRKFDGKLEKVDFKLKKKDIKNNDRAMGKVFDLIGYGLIEDFISDEDIDPEDLCSQSESETDTEDESDSSSDEKTPRKTKLPAALMNAELPNWVKAKRKHRNKHK